ncbi:DoxX family protein [Variovorax sp. PvP013]|uniref:DoxX family protein n=1 Tax=Variovorax sp. PvP013 TaxID=3156435 RepID=UPI003D22691F
MSDSPPSSVPLGKVRVVGIAFVFLWFAIGGVAHFAFTQTEMRIVPPWVPWPRAAVLVSGVFELLGAAGLLWRPTRRWAGIGLFALTIAVTPAHFHMLQRPELFPSIPYWALVVRLPVQVALLALIAWSTFAWRPTDRARAASPT